jgi:hypothetical protein
LPAGRERSKPSGKWHRVVEGIFSFVVAYCSVN